ncbi:MAG: alpha-L-fucosidase [Lachnospiraceae bacterium]|nr:alpha-L-fucosidase [Lachnospiraceae bacterium]
MAQIKKEQLDFLDWELGAFFHFGIRTFYEGHKDWDMQEMSPDKFQPDQLDCKQWISTVKQAGAKYAILVCKHHDGFANWPSAYTDYSVKNTPWKNGNGDVVKEFTDACRKYGLKIGLYYSPAQFGSDKATDYDDYFINQISELLGNYGQIDYLWFDGCGSENHQYDTTRIVSVIRSLQPNILIFNMWDPDVRWIGNEAGLAPMPNFNLVDSLDFSVLTKDKRAMNTSRFLPAECDCRIRRDNWFYSDLDIETIKSTDELMGLYYYSVGRGANLLINIAPDRRGLLPEADCKALLEFGEALRHTFENKLADMSLAKRTDNAYSITLESPTLLNHLVLSEDLNLGENITEFSVYITPYPYGRQILVYKGCSVGHKHICRFPSVSTCQIDVVIDQESAPHKLTDLSIYYAK